MVDHQGSISGFAVSGLLADLAFTERLAALEMVRFAYRKLKAT